MRRERQAPNDNPAPRLRIDGEDVDASAGSLRAEVLRLAEENRDLRAAAAVNEQNLAEWRELGAELGAARDRLFEEVGRLRRGRREEISAAALVALRRQIKGPLLGASAIINEDDVMGAFLSTQDRERARIREELLAEAFRENPLGASLGEADFFSARLRTLANRICPE